MRIILAFALPLSLPTYSADIKLQASISCLGKVLVMPGITMSLLGDSARLIDVNAGNVPNPEVVIPNWVQFGISVVRENDPGRT